MTSWLVPLLVASTLTACATEPIEPDVAATPDQLSSAGTSSPRTAPRRDWRKPRYISVRDAVERLRPHVDAPLVLPASRRAGLPNLRGWLADPRYLDWRDVYGLRVGGLTIRKGRRILILSYGLASFDGCGDRSTAEETTVLGQPALIGDSQSHVWSHVIWPVTETGSTGRYGIAGTYDADDMILLAESMERERLEAVDHDRSC